MYTVLLFYKYSNIPNAQLYAEEHLAFCKQKNLLGRIIIADEGINGTCAGTADDIRDYKEYLTNKTAFTGIEFKESIEKENPFKKLFVRYRSELVTGEFNVSLTNKGKYLEPSELHSLYEKDEDFIIVDMRNEYEYRVGRFKNAETLPIDSFRELPQYLAKLADKKNKKVITYCTGGVRCEKASALLSENGFTDVSQLHGGIDQYARQFPRGYFEGKMYVFDGRVAVSFDDNPDRKIVATCFHCNRANDDYINCANATCNKRLVMCPGCQNQYRMSCSETCATQSRYLTSSSLS